MVFPVVMSGCESWTVKKAECRRIDAFELWCWRRLLRVPWNEMAGWHHWLNGREFEWIPGVGDGQGGLEYCDSWGGKELDTAERLNWAKSCYLKILCCGSGLGKTFTTLKHSFDLLWVTYWKSIQMPSKEERVGLFLPSSGVCVRAFSIPFHFNKTFAARSSEWLKSCLGPHSEVFSFGNHKSDTIHHKLPISWTDLKNIISMIINYGQLN